MTAHLKYLSYLLRHKWFVLVAGIRYGVPLWRLAIHDWSKFLPCEWLPYVRFFYGPRVTGDPRGESGHYDPTMGPLDFNVAWLHHQHANPHHWQHWVLRRDNGETFALPMPEHFVREMVADWTGAGLAQGKPDIRGWYRMNAQKMVLCPSTRRRVEELLAA